MELGPINGNCLEAWSPPETVENAHDSGGDVTNATAADFKGGGLNNNGIHLTPAPQANR